MFSFYTGFVKRPFDSYVKLFSRFFVDLQTCTLFEYFVISGATNGKVSITMILHKMFIIVISYVLSYFVIGRDEG